MTTIRSSLLPPTYHRHNYFQSWCREYREDHFNQTVAQYNMLLTTNSIWVVDINKPHSLIKKNKKTIGMYHFHLWKEMFKRKGKASLKEDSVNYVNEDNKWWLIFCYHIIMYKKVRKMSDSCSSKTHSHLNLYKSSNLTQKHTSIYTFTSQLEW